MKRIDFLFKRASKVVLISTSVKWIYGLLFVIFPLFSQAQVINHFENEDARWYLIHHFNQSNPQDLNFKAYETTVFGIKGDTIIKADKWLKMYSTKDSLFENDLQLRGYLLSIDKKVYHRDTLDNIRKIYDFNLQVGDSAQFLYENPPGFEDDTLFWAKVIAIDSVLTNQTYHKVLYFEESWELFSSGWSTFGEYWIEGIGSIRSPLNPVSVRSAFQLTLDTFSISCTYVNGNQYWQHPGHDVCYKLRLNPWLSVEEVDAINQNVKLFPNPIKDNLIIERTNQDYTSVTIYNAMGQMVHQTYISGFQESINLSHLPKGLYFVQIGDNRSFKIVKD